MKIAVLGDFHYPRMQHVDNEMLTVRDAFFDGMLQRFFELDADYHVSLGDFTNEGCAEELEQIFAKVRAYGEGRSFIHVLGNHDTYSMPKTEILAITGQQRYHAIEADDAVLLFLDSTKEMNREDWGGELDQEQQLWLQENMLRSQTKPVLVFAHHPVHATTARSHMDKLSIHPDIDMPGILNHKQGFGYYFCGHNHQHSIVRDDNWHYIQTAAALDVPAFRLIEVTEEQLTVTTIDISDEELKRHARLIGANMVHYHPLAEAEGEAKDRALVNKQWVSN